MTVINVKSIAQQLDQAATQRHAIDKLNPGWERCIGGLCDAGDYA